MRGNLIIKEQSYPTATGETPLTFGIFLETDQPIDGLHHWQDCEEVFVAYSWSEQGALRAVREIEGTIVREK